MTLLAGQVRAAPAPRATSRRSERGPPWTSRRKTTGCSRIAARGPRGGEGGVRRRARGGGGGGGDDVSKARSYVLRVVESKLKIGAAPELAELRLRLDFNGFYGTKDEVGGGERGGRGGGEEG